MKAQDFDALLDARLAATKRVLGAKAEEYATDADRLHNFKRAAAVLGTTPAQACVGFMTKHMVSVLDMVESGKAYPDEVWDEKLGDWGNYLVLLEGIVKERRE